MKLDAAGVVRLRLSEHAVHTWDVAAAIDPVAVVAPDAVALLTGQRPGSPSRTGRPGEQPFRAPAARQRPRGRFPAGGDGQGDPGTVAGRGRRAGQRGDPDAGRGALRLFYGRLDPAHTPPAEVTGGPGAPRSGTGGLPRILTCLPPSRAVGPGGLPWSCRRRANRQRGRHGGSGGCPPGPAQSRRRDTARP